ncbi:MAG TPA: ATPase [Acidobacteria bacterium]|nr:ATPase [Acidobacteriota bacterium]
MLRSLKLVDFKSFRDTRIAFGPFTVLVGTNASGKSNVQDALRFLHGCAQGFTVAEVMDEKWGPGGLLLWRGIRGGGREIIRAGGDSFNLEAAVDLPRGKRCKYTVTVGFHADLKALGVQDEDLFVDDHKAYVGGPPAGRPSLTRLSEAGPLVEALKNIRFLDLAPDAMRLPSTPGEQSLGDRGENLSTVLLNLTADAAKKEALLGWLRGLTPLDVVDLRFHEDLAGRVLVYLVEAGGREISALSASDGTLRFLALAAALLTGKSGHLFFIEEIDNGLHPTRLHLLLDVIEQATRHYGCQVVATTHNPQLLAYLSPAAREDAVLLYRREHEDSSGAIRIVDLPDVRRILESQDLGRLFATGWLEDAAELMGTEASR